MNKEDICYLPAYEMLEKIKSQELSSLEITEALIERINKLNPVLNAYCTTTFDLAREIAEKADKLVKGGQDLPPLIGIPTSIKDLMQTKGIRTTYGSKLYEKFIPEVNDVAVERLLDAGCVLLGKTNTPEFGHVPVTINLIFGETKNPWNTGKTSGGSSGGSAASVAAGMGPLSLGSDGGGSIRLPSCLCGVFGFKPTFGRIPRYPTVGIAFWTMDHYGPIVRYVKDAALMMDVMKGFHPMDKNTFPDEGIKYFDKIEDKLNKLKIGTSLNLGFNRLIEPEIKEIVSNAFTKFNEFNWSVEEVKLKLKKPEFAFNVLVTMGYAYDLQKQYNSNPEILSPDLVKMIKAGLSYNAIDVGKALAIRMTVYEVFNKYFKDYDILLTPTTPVPAFDLGQTYVPKIAGKATSFTGWMCYTYPFNMTGLPAATVPCGFTKDGLPVGMQIIGNRYNDLLVLQVAKAFEEIAPWQDKKPEIK